jgi:hypothetical protein
MKASSEIDMTNGRQRRRKRQRQQALAQGSQGGLVRQPQPTSWPDHLSRSDLQMIRRCARQGWNPSTEARQRLVDAVLAATERYLIPAAATIVEMGADNARD